MLHGHTFHPLINGFVFFYSNILWLSENSIFHEVLVHTVSVSSIYGYSSVYISTGREVVLLTLYRRKKNMNYMNRSTIILTNDNTAQPVHQRSPISVISGLIQNTRYAPIQKVQSKYLGQTARMRTLSRVFVGRTNH